MPSTRQPLSAIQQPAASKAQGKKPAKIFDSSEDEAPIQIRKRKRAAQVVSDNGDEEEYSSEPEPASKHTRLDSTSGAQDAWDDGEISCHIFKSMCCKVRKDKKWPHVVKYIEQDSVGIGKIWSFVNRLIQSNVNLKRVVRDRSWRNSKALLSIGGKFVKQQMGWYMDVVTSPDETSPDDSEAEYLKKYVGQSDDIVQRIRGHKNEMKHGRQVHYKIAGVKGRVPTFVLLGVWTEDDAEVPFENALLDLVEMYFCLLFQSLQRQTLEKWLPAGAIIGDDGLNVALPLYQSSGDKKELFREMAALHKSSDPEVKAAAYVLTDEAKAKGRETQKAAGYQQLSQGQRTAKGTKQNVRAPETPDERNIQIKCSKCGNVKGNDPDPVWTISTPARYVTRAQVCFVCPKKAARHANPTHKPVDASILTVSTQKVDTFKA